MRSFNDHGRRAVLVILAAVTMATSAACGSTLQQTDVQTSVATSGANADGMVVDGAGDTAAGLDDGLAPGTTGAEPSSAVAAPSAGSTRGAIPSGGAAAGTSARPAAGAAAPEATGAAEATPASDKPIRIGVAATDVGALAAIFGVSDDGYDYFAMDKAFVEYINKTGGINGRKVEVETMMVDIAADADAEGQRVCENFSRDNKVDIVYARIFGAESMIACLRQAGIAVFDPALHTHDRPSIDHPNWIQPVAVGLDRLVRAGIEDSVERGRLKAGDTLGLLHEDCAWGRRIYGQAKAQAESHGVKVVQATVKCVENLVNDLGPVTNQSRSAVLRFRTEGVSDVMIISFPEHFVWAQFAGAAEEQSYRPQYQVTTNAFPFTMSNDSGQIKVPEAQRKNAAGLGFVPRQDVGHEAQPADGAQDAIQAECRKADETMNGATEVDPNDPGGRAYVEMSFYVFCDVYFAIRGAVQNGSGSTAVRDVAAGFATFRSRTASPTLAGGRYGTARLEGGGFVKPFEYNPQTKRFTYSALPMRTLAE